MDEMPNQQKITGEMVSAADAVAKELRAQVFVYSGRIDARGFGLLVAACETSRSQPRRPNSVILLTTTGGDAAYAYRIARLLHTISGTVWLCVPSYCKSAGTLVSLGANMIYMPAAGTELGPLDVQLRQQNEIARIRSGMVVRTALEGLADEAFRVFERVLLGITRASGHVVGFDVASRIAAKIATGVMAPVYAQIDPESLGNDLRNLRVAVAYGERLARARGNATNETVRRLVEDYPTHDFIIDQAEAKELFQYVEEPTTAIENLMSASGHLVYSMQDPHFVFRIDGRKSEGGRSNDTRTEGAAEAGVDSRRKAEG